jgi:glucokinase
LQEVSASLLKPTDVVVVICDSERLGHLAPGVEAAINAGASVIAIASGSSQLARRAHLTLAVEHDEIGAMHIPMVSRILMLLMVDVLAVGVSLSRSSAAAEPQHHTRRGVVTPIGSPHPDPVAVGNDAAAEAERASPQKGTNGNVPRTNLISHRG